MGGVRIASLTRRAHFSASHRLNSPKLTPEQNYECFTKCTNSNGHGHNYYVEVTVKGRVDPVTGMVINLTELQAAITDGVMKTMDHKCLDKDVPYFADIVSTTENVAVFIWDQIKNRLIKPELLHKVKVWSTEKNIVTYYGEEETTTGNGVHHTSG